MNRLELRSLPAILLAYVAAPVTGLTVFWLSMLVQFPPTDATAWNQVFSAWVLILVWGGLIALALELLVLTPLLVGYQRFGWKWLNGRTGALIGCVAVALPWFVFSAWPPSSGAAYVSNGVEMIVDGVRTTAGWLDVLRGTVTFGIVGAVSALTFRLIAVRTSATRS